MLVSQLTINLILSWFPNSGIWEGQFSILLMLCSLFSWIAYIPAGILNIYRHSPSISVTQLSPFCNATFYSINIYLFFKKRKWWCLHLLKHNAQVNLCLVWSHRVPYCSMLSELPHLSHPPWMRKPAQRQHPGKTIKRWLFAQCVGVFLRGGESTLLLLVISTYKFKLEITTWTANISFPVFIFAFFPHST